MFAYLCHWRGLRLETTPPALQTTHNPRNDGQQQHEPDNSARNECEDAEASQEPNGNCESDKNAKKLQCAISRVRRLTHLLPL